MMVRGSGLAASMSRYLIDRIAAAENIEIMTGTEVVGLEGDPQSGLARVHWRTIHTGAEQTDAISNLFLFCGADPATEWLKDCGVRLDGHGFVITGADGDLSAPRCSRLWPASPLSATSAAVRSSVSGRRSARAPMSSPSYTPSLPPIQADPRPRSHRHTADVG